MTSGAHRPFTVQPYTRFQARLILNLLTVIGALAVSEFCCTISATYRFSPRIKVSILAVRELREERWSGEDKRKTWGGRRRRRRETAGSLPCPLSVTFLVNSSYVSPPHSRSDGRKIEKAETNLSTATSPHFISASLPFYNKKARCSRPS